MTQAPPANPDELIALDIGMLVIERARAIARANTLVDLLNGERERVADLTARLALAEGAGTPTGPVTDASPGAAG